MDLSHCHHFQISCRAHPISYSNGIDITGPFTAVQKPKRQTDRSTKSSVKIWIVWSLSSITSILLHYMVLGTGAQYTNIIQTISAEPCLRQLTSGFSPLRSEFNPTAVQVRFMADGVALGHTFFSYYFLLCLATITQPVLHFHLSLPPVMCDRHDQDTRIHGLVFISGVAFDPGLNLLVISLHHIWILEAPLSTCGSKLPRFTIQLTENAPTMRICINTDLNQYVSIGLVLKMRFMLLSVYVIMYIILLWYLVKYRDNFTLTLVS